VTDALNVHFPPESQRAVGVGRSAATTGRPTVSARSSVVQQQRRSVMAAAEVSYLD
jgi:hypothetical protein